MNDEFNESTNENPGRIWLRRLLIGGAVLLVLLVMAYFVVSSETFLKSFVAPRIGKALNAELTIGSASLSPFSQLVLRQVKFQPKGREPLLTAEALRVRYGLISLLSGKLDVQELTLTSPVVHIIKQADGTSNLDPMLSVLTNNPSRTYSPTVEGPPQVNLKNISLTQGNVRLVQHYKDGSRDVTEVTGITFKLDQFQNSKSGKLALAADVKVEQGQATPAAAAGTNNLFQAKLTGAFDFAVDAKLMPQTVKGNTRFDLAKVQGAFAELASVAGVVACDLTPKELRQLALRIERGGKNLGRFQVRGPLDLAQMEGRLSVEIAAIDRQVLNLFTTKSGWDFGQTSFNAQSLIDISQKGAVLAADGKLTGSQVSLRQKDSATPPMDCEISYQFNVNFSEKTGLLRALKVSGKQGPVDWLTGKLDRPMNLSWGLRPGGFKDSSFQIALTNLNLADWQVFLGSLAPAGTANLNATLISKQDGKDIQVDLAGGIQDLTVLWSTNKIENSQVDLKLRGNLEDYKRIKIDSYQLDLTQRQQALATARGALNYHLDTTEARLQTTMEASLHNLLRNYPLPQLSASAGTVKVSGIFSQQKAEKKNLAGNILLTDFTGRYTDYNFQDQQVSLDYQLELKAQALQIHRFYVGLRQSFDSGGSLDLYGKYDLEKKSGQFTFKAVDVNQFALRPFLATSLGDKTLVSVAFNAGGAASYDPQGESSFNGEIKVSNLMLKDPKKTLMPDPLSAQFQVDAAYRNQAIDLRRLLVSLTPTPRATNQVQLKGKLDFATNKPAPSQLTLTADALDATRYYDLYSSFAKTNDPVTAPVPMQNAPPLAGPQEPAPANLPFKQFTMDLSTARFYLRELAITNFQAIARLDKGQLDLKPCKLILNGAPIDASVALNLNVTGYTYDLALSADRIPLAPLANSFSPETKGQYQGDLFLKGQIKGAGTTGINLKKHLTGQADFSFTNANIQLLSRRAKAIVTPIAFLLGVSEITQSPLKGANASLQLANGAINVNQLNVLSDAFTAKTQGAIPIADVLTNSPLNLPVEFSLRRSLAEKSNLLPAGTPTNAAYVKLPDFVKLGGTLGDPKTDLNKLKLAGIGLKSVSGIVDAVGGGKAGDIVNTIGGLLTGETKLSPAAVTNKAPLTVNPTNKPTLGKAATNAPAATSTNKTVTPTEVLQDLLKKKSK